MENAIASANVILYVLFTVCGVMFFLYSRGVEKQMESLKETIMQLRTDSKSDDGDVKIELKDEINRRVGQTTDIHGRVGATESSMCVLSRRVAWLEGLHAEHKIVGEKK